MPQCGVMNTAGGLGSAGIGRPAALSVHPTLGGTETVLVSGNTDRVSGANSQLPGFPDSC